MKNKMKNLNVKKLKVGVNVLTEGVYVYKKLRDAICQMYLPKGTKVVKTNSHGYSGIKYRADQAIVTMIVPYENSWLSSRKFEKYSTLTRKEYQNLRLGVSNTAFYKIGKIMKPLYPLNENPYSDCASGIYFWETLKKAENY